MAPSFYRWRSLVRLLAFACIFGVCPLSARADEAGHLPSPVATSPVGPIVVRLTLSEAKERALANNQALALARLNVAEKGSATAAARKDYLPKVLGLDSYMRYNDNLGSVVTLKRGGFGLLPPGVSTFNVAVLNQDSNLATLLVAQPITKLIAVHAAVQIARAEQSTTQAQLDKGTRELLSGVAQAYYGLLGARRIQSALELQVNLLEQLLRAQPTPEHRIFVLGTRQALAEVSGQVRELTQQLLDLLNLSPCTALELVDPVPGDVALRCAEDAADLAAACNPEIREAQQDIAKAEAALKVARLAYLPDISIMGGYANQTLTDSIQPNIGYLGLTGSYTFFEWGKKHDVTRQRQLDIALAHQHVQVVTDKVRLEARKAYSHYEQAREEYRLAEEMVHARKDAEKAATGSAAVQAKADTAKAELETMKAEIAYRVAHAQLMGLIGVE
jgi:outer membrane protein TolC